MTLAGMSASISVLIAFEPYGREPAEPGGKQEDGMKEIIKKQNLSSEFYTPEKCYITELSNTSDDPDVSIARARVKPGVTTRWHRLTGTVERYYIVQGIGHVDVGELPPQDVTTGDIVLIPPMCRQRITNIGFEDLVFLAICTPRFSGDAYEDVEDDQNVKGSRPTAIL
jgi:mannose-6-phosphate isomerase-like protein (cupin superfamily)